MAKSLATWFTSSVVTAIAAILVYNALEAYYFDYYEVVKPPIIDDTFKFHREERNVSIHEMDDIFITFTNPNTHNIDDHIIFYTLNGSDPRVYGTPYDDHEQSEIGVLVPISKVRHVYKPVTVHAVIGKLGWLDQIIWSRVSSKTLWNPDHLSHGKLGAGFSRIPQIICDYSSKLKIRKKFVVRVWPKRLSDVIKCAYSNVENSEILSNKTVFWRDRVASKIRNASQLLLFGYSYVDIIFDENEFIDQNSYIYVRCSTSSRSVMETGRNTKYSSLLAFTKPKYF